MGFAHSCARVHGACVGARGAGRGVCAEVWVSVFNWQICVCGVCVGVGCHREV